MSAQVQLENLEGLRRKLTIQTSWDEVYSREKKEIQKLKGTVRIHGFRPGKVPEKLLIERYGKGLRQEAFSETMNAEVRALVEKGELSILAVLNAEVETPEEETGVPFRFHVLVEVEPEISLKTLEAEKIQKLVSKIEEANIDEVIVRLQERFKQWTEVSRAAALNDKVRMDFVGYRGDTPFEGGSAQAVELVLGSKQYIPGFEEGLLGVKADEARTLTLKFPEDYHQKELAGAETRFEVTVHSVSEGTPHELNEGFAKILGVKEETMEAVRKELRSGLERELATALRAQNKERVFTKLLDLNPILLPETMVQDEIKQLGEMMKAEAKRQKRHFQIPAPQHLLKQAQQRVHLGLLLQEVLKTFELKVSPSDVRALLSEKMSAYDDPSEMMGLFYNNQDMMKQIENEALELLIVDKLLETAAIEEEAVGYEEAIRGKAMLDQESIEEEHVHSADCHHEHDHKD